MLQASILLFEGGALDPEKSPLLRAEWDVSELDGAHAQPHWHVYPGGAGVADRPTISFPSVPPEPIDFPATRDPAGTASAAEFLEKLPRFHYAMAAQWHRDKDASCRSVLSEDGLLLWLGGCVAYIRGQLPHLSREELLD